MKIHNLTITLFVLGILELISSFLWFSKYFDLSQFILYLGFGFLLLIFAYIYEWMKIFQGTIDEQEKMLNSFDLWVRQEFKKINEYFNSDRQIEKINKIIGEFK